MCGASASALFVEGVVMAVGDNDVVHEEDAHQFASPFDGCGQFRVGSAWRETARRVIVTDGQYGGIDQDCFSHDDADVDSCFGNAAM